MRIGDDYIIAHDQTPSNDQGWSVILNGKYDNLVLKYTHIELDGNKMTFGHEILFNPEDYEVTSEEFIDHIADVLKDIIESHHEKKAMVYYSKKTGERIDYE